MSVRTMSVIWDHYPRGGGEMLVALALADWSNDEGESLRPSIRAVARKTRLQPRQARRHVHAMIGAGFLEVIANHDGGPPGMTRHYRLRLDRIAATPVVDDTRTPVVDDTPVADDTGVMEDPDACHGRPERGVVDDSQTVIRTVINRHKDIHRDLASSAASPRANSEATATAAHKAKASQQGNGYLPEFERLWQEYRRRQDKSGAFREWLKLKPDGALQATMLAAVRAANESEEWADVRYVPHLRKWILHRRWEDAPPERKAKPAPRLSL